MKKMKTAAMLALSCLFLFSAVSCGDNRKDSGDSASSSSSSSSGTEAPAGNTAEQQQKIDEALSALGDQDFTYAQLTGTDSLGRKTLPTIGNEKKYVGLFYFVATGYVNTDPWNYSMHNKVYDISKLLEKYGTYEMNGIAFQDVHEIWWLETIGGHHWIAKRVPDDAYVVMPNQLGIDQFDLEDALGAKKNHLCSADLDDFIENNHLDLSWNGVLNPRDAFGSHDDSDHVYNTPRAWFMLRYLNPHSKKWDGPTADYTPRSDDLPWCMVPEKKITPEDVKYVLSSHYQGTLYDPYGSSQSDQKGAFRSIGINRNDFMALIQMRPDQPEDSRVLEWIAFASNAFNVMVPFYANVTTTPAYLSNTTGAVSTDNFYWNSRMIAAMADAAYSKSVFHIERYQLAAASAGHANINTYDAKLRREQDASARAALREQANEAMADTIRGLAADTLDKVLYELSCQMKNCYSRSDA